MARRERNASYDARYAVLRRIPQAMPSVAEILSYFIVPALLIAAGAMPSVAAFFMPVVLPMLYLLFRRFGVCLPTACIAFYGVFSLVFNYDIVTVILLVFLAFALFGLVLSAQLKPYLLCVAVSAGVAVVGALLGLGIVRLAEGRPLDEVGERYIYAERSDPYIDFMARYRYDNAKIPEDIGKLSPGDAGYTDAAIEYFAEYTGEDILAYAPYYCLHYAGIAAILAYFVSVLLSQATVSPYDVDVGDEQVSLSTRCLGGVRREVMPVAAMKFPRAYLWTVALPGLVASLILDFVGGYSGLSAMLMHAFITLPTAVAFVTLLVFLLSLFRGKARIAAYIVFFILLAAMFLVPMVLLICSMIGLADVLLNLRFWVEFLTTE